MKGRPQVTARYLSTVLLNAGIAISIGATVLSLGMSFTVSQMIAPLRRVELVVAIVILNAVLIPAAAWGLAKATPLANAYVAGSVLRAIGSDSSKQSLHGLSAVLSTDYCTSCPDLRSVLVFRVGARGLEPPTSAV